ncbi:MAG: ABC transporter permease [Bacteroidales bacterium]|nr:ABC transporter permease [Bacteroidales bacterium]
MKIEALIAVRYLFARKHRSVVNIISWISLGGLLVSSAALIIVLSVYNGIGNITKDLFGTFDPALVIEPAEGKTFHTSDLDIAALAATDGIEDLSQIVGETAWITYRDRQAIVRLRGVDDHYRQLSRLDTLINEGSYTLRSRQSGATGLICGGEVFYEMGMHLPASQPVAVHIPRRGTTALGFSLDEAFNIGYAYPTAYFFIQQDIDRQYVVTDIDFVRSLMNYAPDECTALALQLDEGASPEQLKKEVAALLPSSLVVKDRYDQQPLYYKIFRTERLGIYLILSLIVLISTLSLVASLTLLILSKHDDVFVMKSMGMTAARLRRAFRTEGLLICAVATVAGLALGFVVCFLQQQFGIVKMGDGNFVVDSFPVAMRAADFFYTFLLVMTISSLAVWLTVRRARM